MKNESTGMRGFTLVELSIVMIIIGLLIGGVLKGQELIMNARLASTISQVKSITAAYNTFLDMYKNIPGDISSASVLVPNCNSSTSCFDGNGNMEVGGNVNDFPWFGIDAAIDTENTQLWKHMALADLLGGLNPSASATGFSETHPENSINGGFHARSGDGTPYGFLNMVGVVIVARVDPNGQWLCGQASNNPDACSLSPNQSYRIDIKMDDGQAITGSVGSISAGYQTGCGNPNQGINGPDGYARDVDRRSCDVMFRISN